MDKTYRDYLKTKEQYIVPSGFKTELEINPMLFEFQRDIVLWALERGKAAVFADCGLGKGQPIGSKILTPQGWKNIEKLNEGDKVIASNGLPYNVKGVYPKQEQDTWRFHFSDGVSFVVDEDHLHIVRTNNDRQRGKEWRVMSTIDLLECNNLRYGKDDKSRNYDIPVVEPCHFTIENKYTIHPYVLGVLLGDGHLSGNVSISNPDQEIIDKVKMLLPEGVGLNHKDRCEWKIVTGGSGSKRHPFRQELADMELLDTRANSKFIPQEYLFGSVEDRLELLRGLMDTDGYIKDSSQYYTVSDQLADDVMFLIRSLGGVPTRSIKEDPKYTDTDGNIKSGQDCHIITFSLKTFNPFYLSRKAELWNDNPRDNGRWIDKIEYEGKQKTVCISVDSPDQSYVTENFIVTHNTPMQLEWAKHVHKYTNEDVLIVAPLAVAQQTKREGEKFGVEVNICREQADVQTGINITNYEILHKFDRACFGGIVLDESSILKAYGGKTRKQLQKFANPIPYRLACTATPSPNDLIELVNHAEFLDIMTGKEIIGLFFTQDGNSSQKWRLMGHAQDDFWRWMSEWAVALRKPSDLDYEDNGFILPDLHIDQVTVDSKPMEGYLIPIVAKTLSERRAARKSSLEDRVRVCADLVNNSSEKWLIWCDLNAEQDALEKAFGDLAVSIRGTTPPDKRIEYENAWRNGDVPIMITKPLVFGFGMNWQHCHNMAFVGLSDSYEQQYQAVRRCWRFGQENDVNVYMITSEAEGAVVENVKRKEKQHQEMFDNVVKHMSVNSAVRKQTTRNEMEYKVEKETGKNWELYLGDCIEMMDEVESDSVGFSIYSPPFPGMYVYSNSVRDVGNSIDVDAMIEHFRWLVKKDKLYRVTMPGRLTAIHLMQLQAFINRDGYMGLKDYRGKVIQMMIDEGWIFKGEVCIDKNPQLQATRNKEHQLLFKTLASDSSKMRMALADYLIYFQKPGDNPEPIKAGISYKYNPGLTEEDIIELRYEYTDECISKIIERDYPGVNGNSLEELRRTVSRDEDYYHEIDNYVSIKMKDHMVYDGGWITEEEWIKWAMPIWPAYDLAPGTSYYDYLPPVWYRQTKDNPYGIKETDVLNVRQAKETDDERHLCPLQLGVIERAIKLWSAPGDIILSPFAGIGSEGYQALKLDRRFIGMELKRAYFINAIRTLERAEKEKQVVSEDMFSLMGEELTFTDFAAKRTMAAEFNGR